MAGEPQRNENKTGRICTKPEDSLLSLSDVCSIEEANVHIVDESRGVCMSNVSLLYCTTMTFTIQCAVDGANVLNTL